MKMFPSRPGFFICLIAWPPMEPGILCIKVPTSIQTHTECSVSAFSRILTEYRFQSQGVRILFPMRDGLLADPLFFSMTIGRKGGEASLGS